MIRKHRNLQAAMLAALLLGASLPGCGGSSASAPAASQAPAAATQKEAADKAGTGEGSGGSSDSKSGKEAAAAAFGGSKEAAKETAGETAKDGSTKSAKDSGAESTKDSAEKGGASENRAASDAAGKAGSAEAASEKAAAGAKSGSANAAGAKSGSANMTDNAAGAKSGSANMTDNVAGAKSGSANTAGDAAGAAAGVKSGADGKGKGGFSSSLGKLKEKTGKTSAGTEGSGADGKDSKTIGSGASGKDGSSSGQSGKTTGSSAGGKDGKNAGGAGGKSGSAAAPENLQILLTEENWTANRPDSYQTAVSMYFVKASLSEEDAKKYPALAKGMDAWNRAEDKRSEESYAELFSSFKTLQKERGDIPDEMYLSNEITGSVLRADSAVVSILHHFWSYEGGVHGYYSNSGVNFDTATGKELLLTDVVTDVPRFMELVDEHLKEDYADIYQYMTNPKEYVETQDLTNPDAISWSIDSEGVTMYFNPYILGSYSMGAQQATVYFDEAPEVFSEKYTRVPKSYFLPISADHPVKVDTDGDGRRELVDVSAKEGAEEYGYQTWIVTAGSRSTELDDDCYSETAYLLRANNQYYLYLLEHSDNDYSILNVVDLRTMTAGKTPEWKEDANGEWVEVPLPDGIRGPIGGIFLPEIDGGSTVDTEQEYRYSFVMPALTKPTAFTMGQSMEILGSRTGYMTYSVGKDGWPEADSDTYMLDSSAVLQAIADVPCDYVDEEGRKPDTEYVDRNGHVTDRGTLPEGTYVFAIRTDGENWIDLQEIPAAAVEDDGEEEYSYIFAKTQPKPDYSSIIYRVYMDNPGWPRLIDGKDETEFFRGFMYAG